MLDDIPDPQFGIDFCQVFSVCQPIICHWPYQKCYYVCVCALSFLFLLAIFVYFHWKTCRFLWSPNVIRVLGGESGVQGPEEQKRIALRLTALVLIFFPCRLPSWVSFIASMADSDGRQAARMMDSVLMLISISYSALNPIFIIRLCR